MRGAQRKGSKILDRFMRGLTDPDRGEAPLGPAEVTEVIAEARSGLDDDMARELVGAVHELNASALHVGVTDILPLFDNLKEVIYGTKDVEPIILQNQMHPGARRQALHDSAMTCMPTAMGVGFRALDTPSQDDLKPNPNASFQLRVGKQGIWYVQIGGQEPFPIQTDTPITLGRAVSPDINVPFTLGTNSNTSRNHITIQRDPEHNIRVTDHSHFGTQYSVRSYPDPTEYREMRAMEQKRSQQNIITSARKRMDQIYEVSDS
jgi:hypothetical protein